MMASKRAMPSRSLGCVTRRREEPPVAASAQSPRARYREQNRAEIKQIALRQLAEGGTAAVALTRIAKEVGPSGPALYRYFDSRDALLTDLIRDAYADLAAAVSAAADALPADTS